VVRSPGERAHRPHDRALTRNTRLLTVRRARRVHFPPLLRRALSSYLAGPGTVPSFVEMDDLRPPVEFRERLCQDTIPVLGGVLVDQRRSGCGVTGPAQRIGRRSDRHLEVPHQVGHDVRRYGDRPLIGVLGGHNPLDLARVSDQPAVFHSAVEARLESRYAFEAKAACSFASSPCQSRIRARVRSARQTLQRAASTKLSRRIRPCPGCEIGDLGDGGANRLRSRRSSGLPLTVRPTRP
jgi:hypothetical protein